MKSTVLVISCEHAVNYVPARYIGLFDSVQSILSSPDAYDPGARIVAQELSKRLACDYNESSVSRLLVDCSSSLAKLRCFSALTRVLPAGERQVLLEDYYFPYRNQIESLINQHISQGQQVLHLALHSFSPSSQGLQRNAAIGLLYDSKRHGEREVARILYRLLLQQTPAFHARFNYPYPGRSDNFAATLRKKYSEQDALHIDVELNQSLLDDTESLNNVTDSLTSSLSELMQLL